MGERSPVVILRIDASYMLAHSTWETADNTKVFFGYHCPIYAQKVRPSACQAFCTFMIYAWAMEA